MAADRTAARLVTTTPGDRTDHDHPDHAAIREKLRWFEYDHLPPDLREVSRQFAHLAHLLAGPFGLRGEQALAGLQHLLEAKDCAVRAVKARDE